MNIVVDTNVWISGLLFGGTPGKILALAKENRFHILISKPIIDECIRALSYPKFALGADEINMIVHNFILPLAVPLSVQSNVQIVRDANDNMFINLALDGNAQYIVSGDKDLLSLKQYQSIRIVTVKGFIEDCIL